MGENGSISLHVFSNSAEMSQDATLQHYMDYGVESLTPVMAHIAKNVVKVNEGQTKHMVNCWHKSWITMQFQTWWHNCTLDL